MSKYTKALDELLVDECYFTDKQKQAVITLYSLILREEPKKKETNAKGTYFCPSCLLAVRKKDEYCARCGQKLEVEE